MDIEQAARDYERIERAIAHLDAHWSDQPEVPRLAAHVGLSPAHFERMFLRWAGVSPKQFLRFLTNEHAKSRLRAGRDLLAASYDVGLSGPGRLHDLLVTCEAVTPGEYKRRGLGLEISHGFAPTPFGQCLLATTERGICALHFANGEPPEALLAELRAEWPLARLREDAVEARGLANRIFSAAGPRPRLHLRGTNFQLKVWRALLEIPEGELVTYHDIARAIGQPTASRAVGSAVGGNPVSLLVPRHRVIRKTGVFGNYRWGAPRKRALCGWESAAAERRLRPAAAPVT